MNKTREIAFCVNSSVTLPGFPARSEEDFYSIYEDTILRMEFQRNDTPKIAEALEKILFSLPPDKGMEVEKDSTEANTSVDDSNANDSNGNNDKSRKKNKSSLVLRKSHNSINKSRENSLGIESIFISKQKSVSQITRKSSFVAMMVGNNFQEFDPHPQGSIISSLGEVLIPSPKPERMNHTKKRVNTKDPFNDMFRFHTSFSSSSSSNGFEDISPIKPRPGEINDKDMLASSPSTSSLLESSPLSLSSSASSHKEIRKLEERMNEINDEKSVRKEKKTKEKASAKSIRKYSSKRAALLSAQKKKSSPVKVLINSFNVQTDSIRRERKTICELYAQSRTHFILLEKAMQDTLKEFSTVHTLVSKAAKSLQRIHRAYKYQKQPHFS